MQAAQGSAVQLQNMTPGPYQRWVVLHANCTWLTDTVYHARDAKQME